MDTQPLFSSPAAESRASGTPRSGSSPARSAPGRERFEERLEQTRSQRGTRAERGAARAERRRGEAGEPTDDAQVERSEQTSEPASQSQSTAAEPASEGAAQERAVPAEASASPAGAASARTPRATAEPGEATVARPAAANEELALAVSALPKPSELGAASAVVVPSDRVSTVATGDSEPLALEGAATEAPAELEGLTEPLGELVGEPTAELASAREPKPALEAELARAPRSDDGAPAQAVTRDSAPRAAERSVEAAAAKAPAPKEPPVSPERAADMLRQLRLQLNPELRQAVIQLEPRELGRISIKVALRGESAHAELRVEKRSTLDALERQMPELKAAFERAGLGGGGLELRLDLAERGTGEQRFDDARTPSGRGLEHAGAAPRALATALARRLPAPEGVDTYA